MTEQTEKLQYIMEAEGKILQAAKVKAMRRVNENPTTDNLRAYREAEKALQEFERRRLEEENPGEKIFETVAEVHRYALSQGCRVSRPTIDHHKNDGKLKKLSDGRFSIGDVDRYIAEYLTDGDDENSGLQREKMEASVRKEQAQAEHMEIKTKVIRGLYINRSQVEQELAARAAFLKDDLQHFWRSRGMEIIDLVHGDHTYFADLVEHGIELVEEWLDRYSHRIETVQPAEAELAMMEDDREPK